MDKTWLKNKLADKKISQRGLAAMLALDPGSFNRTISGKRRLQIGEAAQIAIILSEPIDVILEKFGLLEDKSHVNVKISGVVDGDAKIQNIEKPISIPPPQSSIGLLNAVQVRSNTPLDRAIIFFGDPVAVQVDRLAILLLKSGSEVVGIALKGYTPKTYRIQTIFGEYMEDQSIQEMRIIADIVPL